MNKIAVVEANPDNMLLINAILDDLYELHEYSSAPEALDGIRQNRPDVVLMDISLPGMDGTEALQHIRNDDSIKDIPVIALTAHAMNGDRENYLGMGFNGYVSKPIVDEDLLSGAINDLLS